MYIIGTSSISHQPTFKNRRFSSSLIELNPSSTLIHPNYSDFIPKMQRRRMSDVLKMSITCATDALFQSKVELPEAIIVGTCMGCPVFTKNFLDKINNSEGKALSPTSFIVSTHNTIAGQISLFQRNFNYNMTHTQGSLSFEQALIDGIMCLEEGKRNVLVGAADEEVSEIYNTEERLNRQDLITTSGTSFFMLSSEKKIGSNIELIGVESIGFVKDFAESILSFLEAKNVRSDTVDLVLFCSSNPKTVRILNNLFMAQKLLDYEKFSGTYLTNSGFAMNLAEDILITQTHPFSNRSWPTFNR